MKGSIAVGWLAGLALGLIAAPLAAQTSAQKPSDFLLERAAARKEQEAARTTTVVVPQRQVIVVERYRGRQGWWKRGGYRVITVYYDGRRFYRHPFALGLRRVVVYERAGRYFVDADQWKRQQDDFARERRDDDRDRRDDRDRHDDRNQPSDRDRHDDRDHHDNGNHYGWDNH